MSSYLRVDGEETPIRGARLLLQRGTSGDRRGFVFQVTAHGRRRMLHLAGWAPGDEPADLTGQVVPLLASGPDAAVDGRFFAHAEVRFGRVRDDLAIISIDGEVEDIEPASSARSSLECDLRAEVQAIADRRHCLSCGAGVAEHATDRDEFVGGYRVRMRVLPIVCPACTGFADSPRHCPTCGTAYGPGDVTSLSDEAALGYTASCAQGHTFSGNLVFGTGS
jgi:predicted nucleic acid-binding Zn ribbon protein